MKQDKKLEAKWEEIRETVLAHFDLDDPAVRAAVARWEEDREEKRDYLDAGVVEHTFTSPEVFQAVIEYFKAHIEENIAFHRAKLAHQWREKTLADVSFALGNYDGFYVESGSHLVFPEFLAVVRLTSLSKLKLLQLVVERARQLAENPDKNWQDFHWPAVEDAFPQDLGQFLEMSGEQGRAVVREVCQNPEAAREVLKNRENLPSPVVFLAELALKIATFTGDAEARDDGSGTSSD